MRRKAFVLLLCALFLMAISSNAIAKSNPDVHQQDRTVTFQNLNLKTLIPSNWETKNLSNTLYLIPENEEEKDKANIIINSLNITTKGIQHLSRNLLDKAGDTSEWVNLIFEEYRNQGIEINRYEDPELGTVFTNETESLYTFSIYLLQDGQPYSIYLILSKQNGFEDPTISSYFSDFINIAKNLSPINNSIEFTVLDPIGEEYGISELIDNNEFNIRSVNYKQHAVPIIGAGSLVRFLTYSKSGSTMTSTMLTNDLKVESWYIGASNWRLDRSGITNGPNYNCFEPDLATKNMVKQVDPNTLTAYDSWYHNVNVSTASVPYTVVWTGFASVCENSWNPYS
ncbi:hypothetical protein D3P09_25465 [Paenibacillus pinisoli]|uniref:Uncharacterized protein n=1 Tax=Paenibacillus pinisoli TaxID=1276110 RepID=A0A3A6PLB7_9BACL|nr:hypothetical protein [Paenibacillus pinisoli]RJX36863.1 hypothetical protein D3P09_25465 [Paenibacillus pinisoli]